MNTVITPAIIARLEAEVCPTHGQKAELFVENDIFSVTKSCCPEFEKHLYDLCSELVSGSDRANALLEQMLGLK